MAFLGDLEVRHGRWGFIGDLLYADLSATEDTPFGAAFKDATVETRLTAFSAYAAYRVHESPRVAVDMAGGFRASGLYIDTSLSSAGEVPDRDLSVDEPWVVPIVGARVIMPFSDQQFATAYADAGGLGRRLHMAGVCQRRLPFQP